MKADMKHFGLKTFLKNILKALAISCDVENVKSLYFITLGRFREALTDFTYPQKRLGLFFMELPILITNSACNSFCITLIWERNNEKFT